MIVEFMCDGCAVYTTPEEGESADHFAERLREHEQRCSYSKWMTTEVKERKGWRQA